MTFPRRCYYCDDCGASRVPFDEVVGLDRSGNSRGGRNGRSSSDTPWLALRFFRDFREKRADVGRDRRFRVCQQGYLTGFHAKFGRTPSERPMTP